MATKKESLLKKRTKLLSAILEHQDFLKGSISRVKKNREVDAYYLTYKDKEQKTHTKYINHQQYYDVKNKIEKMIKVKKIIEAVSEINLELLKKE
jgi:hypothetical protein